MTETAIVINALNRQIKAQESSRSKKLDARDAHGASELSLT